MGRYYSPVTVQFPSDLSERLADLIHASGLSRSALVSQLLRTMCDGSSPDDSVRISISASDYRYLSRAAASDGVTIRAALSKALRTKIPVGILDDLSDLDN